MPSPGKSSHHSQQWVNSVWYGSHKLSCLLLPLSGVFAVSARVRQWKQNNSRINFSVPVIVVGNITVGGTGKTPMVTALVRELQKQGYNPGVASRGYGGRVIQTTLVESSHSADFTGDEPLMIFNSTQAVVAVGKDRLDVIQQLINKHQCDVIVCDDGMQDYRFEHDIEIIMVDGDRGFGNHRLLPAGPLRESINRLQKADFVVATSKAVPAVSGDCMKMQLSDCVQLVHPQTTRALEEFKGCTVHAVAGIGNPDRFFNSLISSGLNVIKHAYPDHARYELADFSFSDQNPILMTEKDAVKCQKLTLNNAWYVPVQTVLPDDFMLRVNTLLRSKNG
tara:strand:+ start:2156 stop:3163 length:1008 start_codon:yes stop_codon:yes gene_type:complete